MSDTQHIKNMSNSESSIEALVAEAEDCVWAAASSEGKTTQAAEAAIAHIRSIASLARQQQAEPALTDAQINAMADRLMGWRLPDNFSPDGGITFKQYHPSAWPTGTNLFDVQQARDMLRAIAPAASQAEPAREAVASTVGSDYFYAWAKGHWWSSDAAVMTIALMAWNEVVGRVANSAAPAAEPMSRDVRMAIMLAYGHLWHVNNEPAAPIPLYAPEKAAYEARKQLRDLLTKQERGEAINQVGALIGRYDAAPAATAPQAAADDYGHTNHFCFAGVEVSDAGKRLGSLLVKALGPRHPAIDDLASLILSTAPQPERQEASAELIAAALAVVERWHTPLWKNVPATAEFITRLERAALATQAKE